MLFLDFKQDWHLCQHTSSLSVISRRRLHCTMTWQFVINIISFTGPVQLKRSKCSRQAKSTFTSMFTVHRKNKQFKFVYISLDNLK